MCTCPPFFYHFSAIKGEKCECVPFNSADTGHRHLTQQKWSAVQNTPIPNISVKCHWFSSSAQNPSS